MGVLRVEHVFLGSSLKGAQRAQHFPGWALGTWESWHLLGSGRSGAGSLSLGVSLRSWADLGASSRADPAQTLAQEFLPALESHPW